MMIVSVKHIPYFNGSYSQKVYKFSEKQRITVIIYLLYLFIYFSFLSYFAHLLITFQHIYLRVNSS
jgi:hypothetical protein